MKYPVRENIGKGWWPLAEPLAQYVEDHGGTVNQVKEKFGGLRFYYTLPADDAGPAFEKRVLEAEDRSFEVCEDCGAPGKPGGKGWIRTLCPDCRVLDDAKRCLRA